MGYKDLIFEKDTLFLVTGGAGFIGSNLCEAILKLGYKVRCLDDLSTGKQKNVDMFLDNPNYEFIKGEVVALFEEHNIKCKKLGGVRKNHTDHGYYEVRAITHLALYVLNYYFSVYFYVKSKSAHRLSSPFILSVG